ncbi:MAG: hypothetical protein ILA34_06460 [Bacteroidaceae bacterium]|nr:hypothetical protein [Bacteroidaceae bacterium]
MQFFVSHNLLIDKITAFFEITRFLRYIFTAAPEKPRRSGACRDPFSGGPVVCRVPVVPLRGGGARLQGLLHGERGKLQGAKAARMRPEKISAGRERRSDKA